MSKKSFGELVRELRIARGLEQRGLADKVKINREPISPATISGLERDALTVSDEMGRKIIDELSPDDQTRKQLLHALKAQPNRSGIKDSYSMGKVFREIMKKYGLSNYELSAFFENKQEKKTLQSLSYWRSGQKLPSGETLRQIIEFLESHNVPSKDLLTLKAIHLYDTILSDARLAYLSDVERGNIAEYARDMILAG